MLAFSGLAMTKEGRLTRLPFGKPRNDKRRRLSRLPLKSLASMGIGFQWVIFSLTIYYFQFAILNSLLAFFFFYQKPYTHFSNDRV
jgi:hypothetical protein